jgi:hypothetical protein
MKSIADQRIASKQAAALSEHHSSHSAKRSEHYHKNVVGPTVKSTEVRRKPAMMTRATNSRTAQNSDTLMAHEGF